ncbi:hypothetical protein R3P38DRAFT_3190024 [Favolaschia claudopus]|uniref:Uncharacterized protein n=1 Tax=Favolaschia claudopus TaxID=2862362 RepID=A0AAW0BPX3_9AGAR
MSQIVQEDRRLKQEALRCSQDDRRPASLELVSWLSTHAAPNKPGINVHERKRLELVARIAARKARAEHLLELRRQALESIERETREKREREERKKLEREKELVAHAARMKALDEKWAAGEERRKRLRFIYI